MNNKININKNVVITNNSKNLLSQKTSIIILLLLMIFVNKSLISQVKIGDSITVVDKSAILELSSKSKGFLVSKMTYLQRMSIDSPALGLMVFQTDSFKGFYVNTGSKNTPNWNKLVMESKNQFLSILDFGATDNVNVDNSLAIQNAINFASISGTTLFVPSGVYRFKSTLVIPSGVKIVGLGNGNDVLQTPVNGSQLRYIHTSGGTANWAIKMTGHNSSISNLVIVNQSNDTNTLGGIQIYANNKSVESCKISDVLIYGFTGGSGLSLYAENSAGIAYCSFYDVRVRHARIGIRIAQDVTSYVNSNSFFHGAISGGAFNYGIRVESGNNNVFYGTIIEPYKSEYGHIVVEGGGSIVGENIRIEGAQQNDTVPLIYLHSSTTGSYLDGTYAGGLTIDKGSNFINLTSGKSIGQKNPSRNLFQNTAFIKKSSTTIDQWKLSNNNVTFQLLDAEILPNYNVLKLTVPANESTTLEPQVAPLTLNSEYHKFCTFGFYVKTNKSNTVKTTFNAPLGVVTSTPHSGNNTWQFIGMSSTANPLNTPVPKLLIQNTTNSNLDVFITCPTFSYGTEIPDYESSSLLTNGGRLFGSLSLGFDTISSTNFIVLPKSGNTFFITGTNTISRINHLTADQFPKGTLVTLFFNASGISITSSAYIVLKSSYTTSSVGSTLTLFSNGNGTWVEISRNN